MSDLHANWPSSSESDSGASLNAAWFSAQSVRCHTGSPTVRSS
eukprot:CAMPEP_0180343470 /NCGR_PEP_ID=MMETSP0989-20121125/2307_1 /TAXON_ID=697907 /ORGANISM="non described non described, Strain CCMP2293" /LENGTH=42 /DNA_ID= /DNA_START= /DNA_END= /DNA_ORIENTATION=